MYIAAYLTIKTITMTKSESTMFYLKSLERANEALKNNDIPTYLDELKNANHFSKLSRI